MVKRASETDQRQSHVYLTQAGLQTIKAIEKSIRKTEKDMLKGLDKKDRKSLLKMLGRMEGNLVLRGAARRVLRMSRKQNRRKMTRRNEPVLFTARRKGFQLNDCNGITVRRMNGCASLARGAAGVSDCARTVLGRRLGPEN